MRVWLGGAVLVMMRFQGSHGGTAAFVGFGAALLAAGFFYPGDQPTVATALIVIGAGQVSIGVVLPRMSEFEIGPSGLKTKMAVDDPRVLPPLDIKEEQLTRFSHLVLGEAGLAREIVEAALAKVRLQQRRVPSYERDVFTVQSLIQLLETAPERRWLLGAHRRVTNGSADETEPAMRPVMEALQQIDFEARVAFLLNTDWTLRSDQIAALLGRPADEIQRDIDRARDRLRPLMKAEG